MKDPVCKDSLYGEPHQTSSHCLKCKAPKNLKPENLRPCMPFGNLDETLLAIRPTALKSKPLRPKPRNPNSLWRLSAAFLGPCWIQFYKKDNKTSIRIKTYYL